MASVGFIGTGEIASAMVNGLTDMGHKIYVSKRGVKFSNKLSLLNDVQISNNQDIINKSDIIILCLLKDIASEVLSKLYFPDDKKIISVMVDVSFSELNILCNPLNKIEITIPLPFIDTGNCPLPCFPTSSIVSDLFVFELRVVVKPEFESKTVRTSLRKNFFVYIDCMAHL